jgi:putative phage-type endonuclease
MGKNESDDIFEIFEIKKKEKKENKENKVNKENKENKEEKKEEKKELNSKINQAIKICSVSGKQYILTQPTNPKLYPFGTSWVHDKEECDDVLDDDTKSISKKLDKLLKIEYPGQRSKAWFDLRKGCISASDAGCVVGDNQHEPQYMMYLKKLLEPVFEPNGACYHGTKLEEIATMVYSYRMNVKVEEFGLVKHPDIKFIGASPDGIVGKYKLNGKNLTKHVGTMLEIKCPKSREINDNDPFDGIKYYERQVQQQLEVCKLKYCHFWQCKIREYETREEFIEDTDEKEPFRSKKFGMEKGCLIQLLPRAKMGELNDKYNDIVYGDSKFLYPEKIDMTLLECDEWVAKVLNNLEKYIVDKIIKKYADTETKILNMIKNAKFMIYYRDEIKARTDSLVKWLIEEKHAKVSEDQKSKFSIKKTNEMMEDYTKNYVEKLRDKKFVRFLVLCELEKYDEKYNEIKKDENIYDKVFNPDLDEKFCQLINSDKELNFIKKLSALLRELDYPKKMCFHRVYYWRVEKTLCTTVKRDKEWFKKHLPIYENMWNNIEYMRENPECIDILSKYIDSLPTVEKHFGKEYKENKKVMDFVDYMCNPPNKSKDEKMYKIYEEKISKFKNKI